MEDLDDEKEEDSEKMGPLALVRRAVTVVFLILVVIAVLVCFSGWHFQDVVDYLKGFSWHTYP